MKKKELKQHKMTRMYPSTVERIKRMAKRHSKGKFNTELTKLLEIALKIREKQKVNNEEGD